LPADRENVLNANALAGSLPCRLDERKQHIERARTELGRHAVDQTLRCIASISIAPLRYLASDALAPRLSMEISRLLAFRKVARRRD
jgi:hypothetical protein